MPNLLLVLKDDKLRAIYAKNLQKHFTVDSAQSGILALRKLRLSIPHVIFCEDELPYLSGFAVLKYVRSEPRLSSVPFVFLSRNHPHPDALSLGGSDWINLNQVDLGHLKDKALHHLSRNYRLSQIIN